MSSSPIGDLGLVSGTAASVRPLRQRLELVEEQGMARLSALQEDGEIAEAAVGAAASETLSLGNVIELDAPQLRRTGIYRPTLATAPRRINLDGVAFGLRAADTGVAAAAGALAFLLQPGFRESLDPTVAFAALGIMAMLVRFPDTEPNLVHGAFRRPLFRRLADAALRTVFPFVVSLGIVIALIPASHALRAPLTHWLALWAMGAMAGTCTVRLGLTGLIAHWRTQGRLRQAVAIFGTGDIAERLVARLQASSADSVELVGLFDDRERRRIADPGLRSLIAGTADDLLALSRRRDIDRVIVALPHSAERRVLDVLKKLRRMPVEISLAPDLIGYNIPCLDPDAASGLPLLEVYGRPLTFGQVLLKSAIDKALALLALTLGAPLFIALAVAIKLDSRGPVLFRQNRYGFGDRLIGVYKFRTMSAEASDVNGQLQTATNDPRVTRVGHFLRRWSLDELPQVINVLRGEMSLVGPRPHAVSMRVEDRLNHDIVPDYAMRHHMKPGITGWAQVNGYHGAVPTEEALRGRVRYDLDYINNWSPWFDLQILLRTIRIVLGQRQAY
jgi:Undecaprenyl-phosphate glucose phosphotransferase